MLPERAAEIANLALEHVTDVSAQRIARVYAEALLNAAEKRGQAVPLLEELNSLIIDLLTPNPQLDQLLTSGIIGRESKAEIIEKGFTGRVSELLFNFLMVLNRHERLDLLRMISAAYVDLYHTRTRRIAVQVRTAVPLPDDQRSRLLHDIRETLGLEPVLDEKVVPDLLGGVVLRVGDALFDGSVRHTLLSARNQLIEKGSHEIQSRRDHFRTAS
jgi:F-type H+-transporting ATPase subunit delta